MRVDRTREVVVRVSSSSSVGVTVVALLLLLGLSPRSWPRLLACLGDGSSLALVGIVGISGRGLREVLIRAVGGHALLLLLLLVDLASIRWWLERRLRSTLCSTMVLELDVVLRRTKKERKSSANENARGRQEMNSIQTHLRTTLQHLLRGLLKVPLEEIDDLRDKEPIQLVGNGVEVVLSLKEEGDCLDGDERLVSKRIPSFRVEDAGSDDRREVLKIHLASGFLVDVRERRDPFEEDEDDLHRVPVAAREKADDEVEVSTTFGFCRESWKVAERGSEEGQRKSSAKTNEKEDERKRDEL